MIVAGEHDELDELFGRPIRGELRPQHIPDGRGGVELVARGGVSPTVLSDRTGELREAGLVELDEPAGYALTPLGRELLERFAPLVTWSERWADAIRRSAR